MATKQTDYVAMTAKYTKNVNADAVQAIVKYCGVSLRSRDASYVAVTDKTETERVIKGFCAKKLGLDREAATAAVAAVAAKMKASRMKHRVAFYYLLAEHTGKLNMLSAKTETKKRGSAKSAAPVAVAASAVSAPKPMTTPTAPAATMAVSHGAASSQASAATASTMATTTATMASGSASSAAAMKAAPLGLWARIKAWFS